MSEEEHLYSVDGGPVMPKSALKYEIEGDLNTWHDSYLMRIAEEMNIDTTEAIHQKYLTQEHTQMYSFALSKVYGKDVEVWWYEAPISDKGYVVINKEGQVTGFYRVWKGL